MNQQIKDAIVDRARFQLQQLLTEHIDRIIDAMQDAVVNNDAKKYKVSLSVDLTPWGSEFRVKAGISYGVKTVDETEPATVSGTMPLPGMSEGGE